MAKMSPEAESHLQLIKMEATAHLNAVSSLMPGYKLTLVARHPTIPKAQMVISEEINNLEEVANAMLTAENSH